MERIVEEYISKSRLYRDHYLPRGIARLRNGAYARVIGTENDRLESDALDRRQLIEVALNYIAEWENQGGKVDQGLRESIEMDQFIAQTPVGIFVEPFPLLLECRKCGALDYYKRTYDENHSAIVSKLNRTHGSTKLRCNHCDGFMQQIPLMSVHRCGQSKPIGLPYQALRSTKIKLNYKQSTVTQTKIVDLDGNKEIGNILQYAPCIACNQAHPSEEKLDGLIPRVVTPTGGDSYITHNIQYISLNTNSSNLIRQLIAEIRLKDQVSHAILNALISPSIREKTCHQLSALMNAQGDNNEQSDLAKDLEKAQKTLGKINAQLELDPESEFALDMKQDVVEQITKIRDKLSKSQPFAESVFSLPEALLEKLSAQRRCYEVMFLEKDAKATSKASELSDLPGGSDKDEKMAEWGLICSDFGIESVSHLSDLSVVLAAIGFSRELRHPTLDTDIPVVLNGFTEIVSDSTKGFNHLYGMTAKTEAIWIRLDPCKVLNWMVSNFNINVSEPTILVNKEKAHLFILEQCPILFDDLSEIQQACKNNHPQETAPFQLLHSIAHSLIDSAKLYSGYDQSTLMEYIFPADLSILFYVTSVQNYTSGGLLTLFRHHLYDWIADASDKNLTCLMDPICSEESGACPSCLQIPRGCETFNEGLSRSFLVGGKINDGTVLPKAFWG